MSSSSPIESLTTITVSPVTPSNNGTDSADHICKLILYYDVPNTRLRLWDFIILFPNFMFLLFLGMRFKKALLKLRATNSPIFLTFYCLVVLNVMIGILRCFVSMILDTSTSYNDKLPDIVLWIILRFFLLMTEMSVVIFGLAFGHLDSRSSIRYVLIVTSLISLVYSICQYSLEIMTQDHDNIYTTEKNSHLFGHGGIYFFFISSVLFTMLYLMILSLPWTPLRHRLTLPVKKSFYVYISILVLLNIICSLGGALLLFHITEGLCIINIATCVYFTFFTPLVYHTFLQDFFEASQSNILFSYKNNDETFDDDSISVSLPQPQSFSSIKADSQCIHQINNSTYINTRYENSPPANALYFASLQSPDSITGYSLESQIIDLPSSSRN